MIRKRFELDTVNPPGQIRNNLSVGQIRNDVTLGDYIKRKQQPDYKEELREKLYNLHSTIDEAIYIKDWALVQKCFVMVREALDLLGKV